MITLPDIALVERITSEKTPRLVLSRRGKPVTRPNVWVVFGTPACLINHATGASQDGRCAGAADSAATQLDDCG
jgi:hypothetical protein